MTHDNLGPTTAATVVAEGLDRALAVRDGWGLLRGRVS
jgi:hypothetical protein